jgi:hypothetical protein
LESAYFSVPVVAGLPTISAVTWVPAVVGIYAIAVVLTLVYILFVFGVPVEKTNIAGGVVVTAVVGIYMRLLESLLLLAILLLAFLFLFTSSVLLVSLRLLTSNLLLGFRLLGVPASLLSGSSLLLQASLQLLAFRWNTFFLQPFFRNIDYQTAESEKLSDYQISKPGTNITIWQTIENLYKSISVAPHQSASFNYKIGGKTTAEQKL